MPNALSLTLHVRSSIPSRLIIFTIVSAKSVMEIGTQIELWLNVFISIQRGIILIATESMKLPCMS